MERASQAIADQTMESGFDSSTPIEDSQIEDALVEEPTFDGMWAASFPGFDHPDTERLREEIIRRESMTLEQIQAEDAALGK